MKNLIKYINIKPEELLELLQIQGPPFKPKEIIKNLDINLDNTESIERDHYDGEIYLNNNNIEIWINPNRAPTRQTFTLAHEIGHLVNDLLPNPEDFEPIFDDNESLSSSFKRDGAKNLMELKANDFAARLLMPKEYIIDIGIKVIESFNSKNNNKMTKEELVRELAIKFEVSNDAMKWRLINLKLIPYYE
jgi:Zn-dependent peptidase ImmA (M78 family)